MRRALALAVALLLLVGCVPASGTDTAGAEHEPATISLSSRPVASPLPAPSPVTGGSVTTYFRGQHPDTALVSLYAAARSTLDIAIYSLTLPAVSQAIVAAARRGVAVRMIVDQSELGASSATMRAEVVPVCSAGVPVRENVPSGFQLMHQKMSVIDRTIGTTGSFNYTVSAAMSNWEMLVVIRNTTVAAAWDAEFAGLWADTAHFIDICAGLLPTPVP